MRDSYQALYRKWRPMTFGDVIGQKQVSDTLRTGIASGRIAHAYLFCGTRGTGKTSTAKIFSRAVNCENPRDGEPCNECPTCRGILNGSIMDVYEMDAASNRGVENIRDIRDEVIYTPAGCTYKVYIIDEVHMLTAEAFNALLKTLEEPPKHALFILATTEPHKIPATVLSRCQRFDFRRIGVEDIAGRLTMISNAEGIDATPDALELIAELGDGSMRDALSLLDRCAAFGLKTLTTDIVTDIVGIADPKTLFEIADAVASGDTQNALIHADNFLHKGKEAQNFLEELISHFRSLMICKATDDPAKLLERTSETAEKFKQQAQMFSVERILYSIQALSESLAQSKSMSEPKIAAEMAMVKICNPDYSTKSEALLARIEKLERIIQQGGIVQTNHTFDAKDTKQVNKENNDETPPWSVTQTQIATNQNHLDEDKTSTQEPISEQTCSESEWDCWAEALQEVKKESKTLYAFLYSGKAFLNGETVELELDSQFAYDRIAKPEGIEYLSKLFSRISGRSLKVEPFVMGQREKEEKKDAGIFDLAAKKDLLGKKLNIINNKE